MFYMYRNIFIDSDRYMHIFRLCMHVCIRYIMKNEFLMRFHQCNLSFLFFKYQTTCYEIFKIVYFTCKYYVDLDFVTFIYKITLSLCFYQNNHN